MEFIKNFLSEVPYAQKNVVSQTQLTTFYFFGELKVMIFVMVALGSLMDQLLLNNQVLTLKGIVAKLSIVTAI